MAQTGIQEHLLIGRRARRRLPIWLQAGAMLVLVSGAIGAITWSFYAEAHRAMIGEIHEGLLRTAAIALRRVDPEQHKRFTRAEDEPTAAYQQAILPLRDILLADPTVAFVYSAILRDGKVHFVLDATPPPTDPALEDDSVDVMEVYEAPPADLLIALREGRQMVSQPYTDRWGSFISAYQPFHDSHGALVGVVGIDLQIDNYHRRLAPVRRAAALAGGSGVLLGLLMAAGVVVLRRTDRTARDLARQLRMTNALLAVSRAMGPTVALSELLPLVAKQLGSILGVEHARLHLLGSGDRLSSYDGQGLCAEGRSRSGLLGEAMQQQRPMLIDTPASHPSFDPEHDLPAGIHARAMLLMPIVTDGKAVAVMQVINPLDGASFDDETRIILGAIGAQIQAAIDRARLADAYLEKLKLDESLKLAASIQMSMLSRSFPPPSGAVEVHASLLPAKQVGGDFYDFFWLDGDRIAVLVADVSGKGVPAALFMAKAKTVIKGHALAHADPATVIAAANNDLALDNDNGMFVTVLFAILDARSGELRFCNGGHTPAYRLRRGGEVAEIRLSPGIALGVMEDLPFATERVQLAAGEAVFLYTDGVNEAMDSEHQQFDYPRLIEVLCGQAGSDAESINRAVIAAVAEFAAGAEQSDDITVLALRWRGAAAA